MVKIEVAILRFLNENNTKKVSIVEISKALKINYKNVFDTVKILKNNNLINIKKIGNTNQISYNFKFNEKILKVEIDKLNDILKNINILSIKNKINEIKNKFFILLLFGSYSKNKQRKNSDIDLCLICDDEKTEKTVLNKLDILPLNLEIQTFTTDEFINSLKSTEFTVISEIKRKNIIIKGIEDYYNLLN
jgi:predicted nucleotidyltransferase